MTTHRFARVTRLMIVGVLSLLVAVGSATATDLPLEGRIGIEAVPFRADCPTGYYLVGINGRAGSWTDAVQTVCAPWYVEAGVFGNKIYGIHYGGQGGAETSAVCPFNSAIGGWGIEVMSEGKRYVEEIQVSCRATAGSKLHVAIVQFGGANQNPYSGTSSYACREGQLATGIHGRASAYIEAIGLICGPEPLILEGPTTTTPQSSAPPPDRDRAIVSNQTGASVADVVRKPNVDIVSNQPGAVVRGSFTGVWATVTAGGGHYTMTLTEEGGGVGGSYVSQDGRITGTIDGRIDGGVLVYRWTEGSSAGSGKFTLAVGGNSFAGWWNSGDDPNVAQNSWNGTRK